jgi:hypothetical protein
MMRTIIAVSALAILVACNDTGNNTDTNTTPTADTPAATLPRPAPEPVSACFINITKKDSVELRISTADTVVTGSLRFKNFEKDSSKGTLVGVMKGDTLVGQYTFQSEGTTSVREVVFLIKDSTATEGYGDVAGKEGKMVFKDRSKLNFNKSRVLKKISCGDIAE